VQSPKSRHRRLVTCENLIDPGTETSKTNKEKKRNEQTRKMWKMKTEREGSIFEKTSWPGVNASEGVQERAPRLRRLDARRPNCKQTPDPRHGKMAKRRISTSHKKGFSSGNMEIAFGREENRKGPCQKDTREVLLSTSEHNVCKNWGEKIGRLASHNNHRGLSHVAKNNIV